MDNKATTKRMIGAVVLVLVAALLLAWLLKGKNRDGQQDMAMNQTGETKPILGFPGIGGDAQKPSLLGEDQNAAAQNQQQPGIGMTGMAGMEGAQQQAAAGGNAQQPQGGSLIPGVEVKMPGTAQNTTGFDVRPGGEVRDVVDTDGKVKDGTGSMGTGDAKPDAGKTADAGQGAAAGNTAGGTATAPQQGQSGGAASQPVAGGSPSASQQDKPAATPEPEKKSGSKVVLVNEKPVPRATSTESASAKAAKEAAAKKAAADAAAKKAAADKAAADKSKELAKPATGGAAAAAGGFSIQVLASADKAKADAVAAPLKADGYNVSVATASVGGKTIYRVSVSGFADRAAADAAQSKMKSRYKQNQAIQGSFVTSGK